jgi:hypothetical protein
MANEVTRRSVVDLDGFSDFTSEVEGEEDVNLSSMIIKGMKIKYIMPHWLDSAEQHHRHVLDRGRAIAGGEQVEPQQQAACYPSP